METSKGGRKRSLELFKLMQTKNTIKQLTILFLGLVIGEGIFGVGVYWPLLLIMKDKKWIFWLAFGCGLFLSVIYSQKIGLMSLFLTAVVTLVYLFVGGSRGHGKWLALISIVVSGGFDFVFGLPWSVWEVAFLAVAGLWVSHVLEGQESIKLNY